ncbi:MAG: hydrolase [Sphingomonas sanxanigenens]|uniref:Hydrolase n=1 Tax=Sphingomonas sanxanigenens TaxID=397260 RepID=A0A2W5AEM0_9SPHN|nr:MAG: hydrolase [Sphingomonas sanxanigenens]
MKRLLGLMLAAAVVVQPVAALAADAQPARTLYTGATLIDGNGGPARRDMAVLVEGERIAAVLPAKQLSAAQRAGASVVDLSGRYLIPGLIDTHIHTATPPNRRRAEAILRRDLYGGVTAVRDMADDLRSVAELTRAALVGEIASPDIYFAALMAGPSFFDDPRTHAVSRGVTAGKVPWMQAITEQTDMPIAVAIARGTGASAIKIYANLPGDLVAKIVAEAHRQGIAVWTHSAIFPATPQQVIDAAPDVVSHVCYMAYQVADQVPASYQQRVPVPYDRLQGENPVITGLFKQMVAKNIILDATGRVYLEYDAAAGRPGAKPALCSADVAARMIAQAWKLGVQISTGTDGNADADSVWPELFDELDFLANRVHIPTAQVIRSATLVGARAAGAEKDMGTIEPGKLANLVVLTADPLADIHNVKSVETVVKRGHAYPRADFKPLDAAELKEAQ